MKGMTRGRVEGCYFDRGYEEHVEARGGEAVVVDGASSASLGCGGDAFVSELVSVVAGEVGEVEGELLGFCGVGVLFDYLAQDCTTYRTRSKCLTSTRP